MMETKLKKTSVTVLTAMMMCIIMVAIFVLRIPIPFTQGYVNLSDAMIFLAVIMLGSLDNGRATGRRQSCMAGLQEILKMNMRKGDIITRFSDNTFAMLLPMVNYTSGSMVMERIEHLYYQEYASLAVPFHARISPLGQAPIAKT